MPVTAGLEIQSRLGASADEIDVALSALIDGLAGPCQRLIDAMRHSLTAGGKRFRPTLVLWSCEASGGRSAEAMPAALAIECVHTFSLIHDDLPALDNDDLRRGRPACHKAFDEATAILAGDGLLALAFEVIAGGGFEPTVAVKLTRELAAATGPAGMIGGEMADLVGESEPTDAARVAEIHAAKTARIIQSACRLGGLAADAGEADMAALSEYGHQLGLAFQATDDLLDVVGSSKSMGKRTGKDAELGKQSYPRAVGIDDTRSIAAAASERAVAALAPLGSRASNLSALAEYVIARST